MVQRQPAAKLSRETIVAPCKKSQNFSGFVHSIVGTDSSMGCVNSKGDVVEFYGELQH
jgi:hypothetical protein